MLKEFFYFKMFKRANSFISILMSSRPCVLIVEKIVKNVKNVMYFVPSLL